MLFRFKDLDGSGDLYQDKLLNKDYMELRMDRFWLEIHKSIYTILQLVFVQLVKHYIIVSNSWMDIGKNN